MYYTVRICMLCVIFITAVCASEFRKAVYAGAVMCARFNHSGACTYAFVRVLYARVSCVCEHV